MKTNSENFLTADDLDAIGEVLNISMGAAATAVSSMLDKRVLITTPNVELNTFDTIDYSKLEPAILVKINYVEGIEGANVIILRRNDMRIILDILMGNDYTQGSEEEFEFDESIVEKIKKEVNSIIGLAAWDINQLNTYIAMLNQGVQFYDNAIQDIKHARLDKRPPAHIRTKIDGIMNDLEEKRRDVKQTRNYVNVLVQAIKEQWSIGKIKAELSKSKYVPYKGRTKYYDIVEEMVKDY